MINLYAEFLLHIRHVTIYAHLHSADSDDSRAYIRSDRKSLTVTHNGDSATIIYPSGISGKATIDFLAARSQTISLRLEIVEDDKPSHGLYMDVANDSPWPASSLTSETQVACRSCNTIVIKDGPHTWKDLPRSDWAELMDYWHCHKPPTEASPHQQTAHKGYATTNKPVVQHGIGFVDNCHLLVSETECPGLKVCFSPFHCTNVLELGKKKGPRRNSNCLLMAWYSIQLPYIEL